MASLSYCVFENTAIDMQQCVNMMHDATEEGLSLGQFLKERGQYEAPAVKRLVALARDLLMCYDILENSDDLSEEEDIEDPEDEVVYDEL